MSTHSIVTEKYFNDLRELAEHQENQRAIKINNRIRKKTHDIKIAENLSPTTKKLDEVR